MQSDVHPKRKLSLKRTNSATKKDAVVLAAASLFAECGYAAVSVDRIADAAKVSKATVYHKFSCKEEIFGSSVEFLAKRQYPTPPHLDPNRGARHTLRALATWLRDNTCSPDFIEFYRLCLSEGRRFPDVTQHGYTCVMTALIEPCERAFHQMKESGQLRNLDAKVVAEQFYAVTVSSKLQPNLFGIALPRHGSTEEEVDQISDLFLQAYGRS